MERKEIIKEVSNFCDGYSESDFDFSFDSESTDKSDEFHLSDGSLAMIDVHACLSSVHRDSGDYYTPPMVWGSIYFCVTHIDVFDEGGDVVFSEDEPRDLHFEVKF